MALAIPDQIRNTFPGEAAAVAKASDLIGDFAVSFLIALGILLGTLWLSKAAGNLVRQTFNRLPKHHDDTLADFASSMVRYAIVIIGAVAILQRLGVQTTSIITVLGAASLAIGLALQGALSNVAAGVMILIFRPFRVGDTVLMAGKQGTVKRLDLFNTELADADGLKVFVPNGKGFGDVIVNYTDIPQRRIELDLGVSYDDDLDKARALAVRIAGEHPKVLETPAPWSRVTDLGASSVTVKLRCWTTVAGYWDTRYEILQAIKAAFEADGLSFPYPTQVSLAPVEAPGDTAPPPPGQPDYRQGGQAA